MQTIVVDESDFLVPSASFLLALLVLVALSVVWLWALVDAVRRPDGQWIRAGQSQVLWVLVIVFFHILGTLLYLTMARPALRRTAIA